MKILPTIGPVSNSFKSIKTLNKFSSVFRLNGSHNTINWHKQTINKIKKINKQNQILLDIPGVKPRTANKESIIIKKNQIVTFFYKKNSNNGENLVNLFVRRSFSEHLFSWINDSASRL